MGLCKSDQKTMPLVGFLMHTDCDLLRAKSDLHWQITPRTIIPPTTVRDSAPPLGLSPQRLRRRKKGRNIHVGRKLPYLEQKLEKRKGSKKSSKKFNKNFTSSV